MRTLLLLPLAILISISCLSQTDEQEDLISSFFSSYGKDILQDAAHPISICTSSSVRTLGLHIYFITLHYKYGSQYFSCEYRLDLDATGHFLKFSIDKCGDKDAHCFSLCRFIDFDDITTSYDRSRYEKYLDKSLEYMTCEQYAMVKLYFKWVDNNYYDKY